MYSTCQGAGGIQQLPIDSHYKPESCELSDSLD